MKLSLIEFSRNHFLIKPNINFKYYIENDILIGAEHDWIIPNWLYFGMKKLSLIVYTGFVGSLACITIIKTIKSNKYRILYHII